MCGPVCPSMLTILLEDIDCQAMGHTYWVLLSLYNKFSLIWFFSQSSLFFTLCACCPSSHPPVISVQYQYEIDSYNKSERDSKS